MNVLEEKVIDWSQQEFNIKMQSKDSLNFLRSKNGNTFKKLLNFMSDRIKSKENGEQIKRFCDSIQCHKEMKTIEHDFQDIESRIKSIRNKLLDEELNRKGIEFKANLNQNKEFVSTLILNSIEKISAKNKHFTQMKPNLNIISQTIDSYDKLFTANEEFGSQTNHSSDETQDFRNNIVLNQILEQINQLMTEIDSILYELSRMEVNKPIRLSIDSKSVFKCLVESTPEIEINFTEEHKDNKMSAIASKLVSIENLMSSYQTIRSEKLSKNREKLKKVTHSCDEFIKQIV